MKALDALPNPYEVLAANARRRPERPALKLPKAAYSYREFLSIVDGFADILLQSGFQPGMRVIVMVKPGLELYALAFALFKLRGTPVIVDPGMGLKRILRSYQHVGAEVFIGIPLTQVIRRFARRTFACVQLIYSVNRGRIEVIRGGPSSPYAVPVPISPKDLAFITFTTGSTGPAKAVEASFGMLDAAVHIIRTQFDQGEDEKDLVSMPFFGLISLMIGSTVVIPDMNPGKPAHIDPARIARTIEAEGITCMLASPAFYDRLSRYAEAHKIVFPTLRMASCGGAPMTLDIMHRTQRMLGPQARLYVCWGATEGLPLSYISVPEVISLKGSVIEAGLGSPIGYAVPGIAIEIIAARKGDAPPWSTRQVLEAGEVGEIIVSGPNVSDSYYQNVAANREHKILAPDGEIWHRTGDLGYLDAEGRLIFTGRMAHLVRNGEEVLHSVACEGVSNSHPDIKRSALVEVDGSALMLIELNEASRGKDPERIRREVLERLQSVSTTRRIRAVRIHRSFPVDPRHNAKIERAKLALWAAHTRSAQTHIPKLVPIFGWAYLLFGCFVELQGFWLFAWWVDLFLSTVAHAMQIPKAIEVAELHGYTKGEIMLWTLVFGATFWKPLDVKASS